MAEEVPKGGAKSGKREGELSHPLVNKVLSTISEIERKEEKETSQAKTSLEAEEETPEEAKHRLRKKINFVVNVFSILVALSFAGWFLVAKSIPLKTWLVERFSILTHRIIREKDVVWIKRRVPAALKKKEFSTGEGKIGKDVKGIPVDVGARGIRIYSQDGVSTLSFVTSEPMDRVVNFYKREMERRGYGLVKDDYWPGGNIAQLLFSGAGKECTISLVENETGGVSVAISYTE
jgi:hypothetical protein